MKKNILFYSLMTLVLITVLWLNATLDINAFEGNITPQARPELSKIRITKVIFDHEGPWFCQIYYTKMFQVGSTWAVDPEQTQSVKIEGYEFSRLANIVSPNSPNNTLKGTLLKSIQLALRDKGIIGPTDTISVGELVPTPMPTPTPEPTATATPTP